ncbi:hypothetical protein JCM30471_31100 [Desulfuromonas carbonis]
MEGHNGTLSVQNSQGDVRKIFTFNDSFMFSSKYFGGDEYAVAIYEHPIGQHCTIDHPTGIAGAPVDGPFDFKIVCTDAPQKVEMMVFDDGSATLANVFSFPSGGIVMEFSRATGEILNATAVYEGKEVALALEAPLVASAIASDIDGLIAGIQQSLGRLKKVPVANLVSLKLATEIENFKSNPDPSAGALTWLASPLDLGKVQEYLADKTGLFNSTRQATPEDSTEVPEPLLTHPTQPQTPAPFTDEITPKLNTVDSKGMIVAQGSIAEFSMSADSISWPGEINFQATFVNPDGTLPGYSEWFYFPPKDVYTYIDPIVFGGGMHASLSRNLNHPGTYTVIHKVFKNVSSNWLLASATKTFTVTIPPTDAAFVANPTTGPAPLTVSATATNPTAPSQDPYEFEWTVSGTTPVKGSSSYSYTFTTPGVYAISLKATDPRTGASSTSSVAITVTEPAIEPPPQDLVTEANATVKGVKINRNSWNGNYFAFASPSSSYYFHDDNDFVSSFMIIPIGFGDMQMSPVTSQYGVGDIQLYMAVDVQDSSMCSLNATINQNMPNSAYTCDPLYPVSTTIDIRIFRYNLGSTATIRGCADLFGNQSGTPGDEPCFIVNSYYPPYSSGNGTLYSSLGHYTHGELSVTGKTGSAISGTFNFRMVDMETSATPVQISRGSFKVEESNIQH